MHIEPIQRFIRLHQSCELSGQLKLMHGDMYFCNKTQLVKIHGRFHKWGCSNRLHDFGNQFPKLETE